ncbi:hypothetical protein [Prevotella pallens]|uniref:hypothetical protein n=1 Tax=Prevotella pallens TaxID=60133 RepID=UPI001CACEA55|nr:hypothetical protein [Prevotella pallens]MBF1510963.1 hypothetical protein [Prevotella pallens]
METHIWLWKYAFLVTQGYGRDESAPTPNGMFATNFTECSPRNRKPFATYFVCVRHTFIA